jgi:plasmid maintenance system antidote protein VapI
MSNNRALKVAIVAAGLTQRRVSIACSIPEARLSAAVTGRVRLTDDEIRRLACVLDVPAASLALPLEAARVEPAAAPRMSESIGR